MTKRKYRTDEESHSKTTLTAQKQEVVQVTFEQPAVSEHPQSCLSKDAKADAAILGPLGARPLVLMFLNDAMSDTLTIFRYRMIVVRVLVSKFLLYHFGIKAVIILKYHGDTN